MICVFVLVSVTLEGLDFEMWKPPPPPLAPVHREEKQLRLKKTACRRFSRLSPFVFCSFWIRHSLFFAESRRNQNPSVFVQFESNWDVCGTTERLRHLDTIKLHKYFFSCNAGKLLGWLLSWIWPWETVYFLVNAETGGLSMFQCCRYAWLAFWGSNGWNLTLVFVLKQAYKQTNERTENAYSTPTDRQSEDNVFSL